MGPNSKRISESKAELNNELHLLRICTTVASLLYAIAILSTSRPPSGYVTSLSSLPSPPPPMHARGLTQSFKQKSRISSLDAYTLKWMGVHSKEGRSYLDKSCLPLRVLMHGFPN